MRTLCPAWTVLLVGFVSAALLTPAAIAQDAQTDQAQALLKQGGAQFKALDFRAAQTTLLEANKLRDRLGDAQRKELDAYLSQVGGAIKKQTADMEAYDQAVKAVADNDLEKARDLFERVAASDVVTEELRKSAREQRASAIEKLKAAKAAAGPPPAVAQAPPAPAPVVKPPPPQPSLAEVKLQELQVRLNRAKELLAKGEEALASDQVDLAITCFQQAVDIAPEYDAARQGLARARSFVGQEGGLSALSRLERMRRIQKQETEVRYDQAILKAREAIQASDRAEAFARAAEEVNYAQTLLATNKDLFTEAEYRAKRIETDKLAEYIAALKETFNKRQVGIQAREIEKARLEREREVARQKAEKIETLKARVRVLREEQKYSEAVEILDRIHKLDPNDAWATEWLDQLSRFEWLMKEREFHKVGLREEVKQLVDLRETQIPWYELLRYPRNWEEIRERPAVGMELRESAATKKVRKKLTDTVPKLEFSGISFNDVIQFLRDVSACNIEVNWGALTAVGIDKTTPVNDVKLTDVTFETALRSVLKSVGGINDLNFVVKDGIITISTKDDLAKDTLPVVYDIRDLIVRVPNFAGPSIDISQAGNNAGGNNNAGGTSGGLFGNNAGGNNNAGEENIISRTELVRQIRTMITETVDRNSWVDNSGTVGNIQELGGQFVIRQTRENHQEIMRLLEDLRQMRTLQINIEARFITVASSFLNNIGVDINFFLQPGAGIAYQPTTAVPPTVAVDPITGARLVQPGPQIGQWNDQSGFAHLTALPVRLGSAGYATPGATGRGLNIASTVVPDALSIQGTFLDDIQVDFLIRATQAHLSSRTLLAPRITIYNGQRAYVVVAQERAYVSGIEPIVDQNVVGTRPLISRVATGMVLDVEGTVSADRKYVTMTIRPTQSDWEGFVEYQSTTPGVAGSGTIQLPIVSTRKLECTVSVPDGGTLLLGGQKEVGEREREMGVPMISKIPILNRAFTNRSKVRDEQTILIMVKPKIIIQKEYEDAAFPPQQ